MKLFRLAALAIIILLSLACALPAVQENEDTQSVLETMVAATIQSMPTMTMAQTFTATLVLSPTLDATPTEIPTETPLPTIPPLPTLTPVPTNTVAPTQKPLGGPETGRKQGNDNFACVVLSRIPPEAVEASAGQDIPVAWRVKNLGKRDWEKENIDFGYVSGQKMSIGGERFDLSTNISSGQAGDILVTFEAPHKAGSYTTTWALYRGSTPFCEFTFAIVVK